MPLIRKPEAPWVEPTKASLPTLPQNPHPTRLEEEVLEMRRHYQRLLEMLFPAHELRDEVMADGQEGTVPPWARRVNINTSGLSTGDTWSFSLDRNVYQFSGPGLVSLPCGRRSGWAFTCSVADAQVVATFTSDPLDITRIN